MSLCNTGAGVTTQDIPIEPSPAHLLSKQVLVVEDEPLLRLLIADELRDSGYDVSEAGTADAALSMMDSREFDLILTDVHMPGSLNGVDLAERVRSDRPAVKIIIFSGNAPADDHGPVADMVLKKPVDFPVLLENVGRLLN